VPKLQLTSGKPDKQEPDQRGEEQQAFLADISGPYDERPAGLQSWKACCTWFHAGVYVLQGCVREEGCMLMLVQLLI